MIGHDWIDDAARKIADNIPGTPSVTVLRVVWMKAMIRAACPFEEGIAYMPVPRCDGCKRWHHDDVDSVAAAPLDAWVTTSKGVGKCHRLGLVTTADFGCVQWENRAVADA